MSQEPEPSIHDYARFHGLVQGYQSKEPLEQISLLDEHIYQTALEDLPDACKHPSGSCLKDASGETRLGDSSFRCTTCLAGEIDASQIENHNERMFIDAGSASMLASISQSAGASPYFLDDLCLDTKRCQRLKRELPLLCSDPECDLQEFIQPFAPNLRDEFLPFETLDEEADEGLTWPSKYLDLPNELWKNILTEKPKIPIEALRYISEATSYDVRNIYGTSLEMLDEEGLTFKKRSFPEPSTPPLLPMSPERLPFVPSSAVGNLDLLSDQPSPNKDELRKMELQVFAKDAIKLMAKAPGSRSSPQSSDPMLLDSDCLGDFYSPFKSIRDPSSSPPDDRMPPRDLKVEVPLSEMGSDGGPPWKRNSVSFNEFLTKIIPSLPEPYPNFGRDTVLHEIDTCFSKSIKPIAVNAERRIEQEQLQKADTIGRIAVPRLDFTLPTAPWKVNVVRSEFDSAHGRQNPSLLEMKHLQIKDHVWPLREKAEQDLQWTPFPTALGKVELQETMPGDGSLTIFYAQLPSLDSHTLTWKPEGLRILDEIREPNGDELDEGSSQEEQGFDCLIRKRRLDLQANEEQSSASKSRLAKATHKSSSMIGSTVSVLASLENFIHTRIGDVRLKAKSEVNCATTNTAATPVQLINTSQRDLRDRISSPWTILPSVSSSSNIIAPQDRRMFIVSSTLLRDRKLVRQIQKRYAAAELVVRDFLIHTCPKRNASLPTFAPLNALPDTFEREADMILSPSTGLIRTTLRKVKQRSLPGKAAQSAMRDRIAWAAPRYERLIIIIDEDRLPSECDQNPLGDGFDSSDSEAIAYLIAFCSGLEDSVQVLFSSGGVEELSKWIVALMIEYGVPYPGIQLIQDETLWEIFLRRAGMNAYAAQVVLGKLDRENMDRSASSDFGLTAFVKMSAGERFARFERLLGGRKLLSRVNQIFEARW